MSDISADKHTEEVSKNLITKDLIDDEEKLQNFFRLTKR